MQKKEKSFGVTLIEVVLYSALMLTVFTTVFGIFIMAMRSYNICDAKISVQRATLTTSLSLARELEEASIYSVAIYRPEVISAGIAHYPHGYYDSSNPNNLAGISFLSPRKETTTGSGNPEQAEYGSAGNLQFWSCVCYYLVPEGGSPPLYTLKRKMKVFTAAQAATAKAMYSPEYFSTGSGLTLKSHIIARSIQNLDIYWWRGSGTGTDADDYGYSLLSPVSKVQYGLYNPANYDSTLYANITSYQKTINQSATTAEARSKAETITVTARENITFYNNK